MFNPNGYRMIPGGTDHMICVWNLLPCISARFEKKGLKKNAEEETKRGGRDNKE